MLENTLFITEFALTGLITLFVLLQKSSSIGLGAYSGSNESVFGAKGPASFLAKTTFVLGFLFVVNTIALAYLYSNKTSESILNNINISKELEKIPQAPKVDDSNTLKQQAPQAPANDESFQLKLNTEDSPLPKSN